MPSLLERTKLLHKAKDDVRLQRALIAQCKNDVLFWFDWFAWTFNPRVDGAHLPFNLYDFQRDVILLMHDCIKRGEPLIIEKSRDMGLSWMVLLIFQYWWLFQDGADFLLGSRTQDEVDQKGNRSTLFEKFRYNINRMPLWMCPKLERHHNGHMKIINPTNGNVLSGEASTPDFGRSQRYRAVLMDEVARHPYGDFAYASVSQSTNCIILLFTPFGKANIAYRMRSHEDIEWVDIGGKHENK